MIRSNWIKLLSARAYAIHRKHSFVYKYSSMMTSSSPLARYSQNLFSKIGRAKETSLLRPFSKASYLKTSTGVFRKVFMVGGDGFTAKYSFKHGDYQLTKDDDCAHTIMRLQCIFDILGMMTTRKSSYWVDKAIQQKVQTKRVIGCLHFLVPQPQYRHCNSATPQVRYSRSMIQ